MFTAPQPVLLIGTYDENGVANVMNVAWGGQCSEHHVALNLGHERQTLENMRLKKEFTVMFATEETMVAADYLGIVSGLKVHDKVAKSGLTVTKSEFVDAPVINELPLVLECRLVSMNEENCNVVGKIVNCAVEESAMTDGKPDAGKMKPICFDTCAHVYRIMGDAVANAFSIGKSLHS